METRNIGSLEVTAVGLGTNNFGGRIDEQQSEIVLDAAIDAGINFIDTADMYGDTKSESYIGKYLGSRRSKVLIATKFGMLANDVMPASGKPEYVRHAVEASLQRLSTDYIDLYIYHRPDPNTPIADTLEVLAELVAAGKVRELGCSNFTLDQLVEAEKATKDGAPRFVNLQNNFSVLHREVEQGVLAECVRQSIGFVPYSPIVGGLLSGKYHRGAPLPEGSRITKMSEDRRQATLNDRNFDLVERLSAFAEARGHTILELAISWLLAQPAVSSIITGATSVEQVHENIGAASWRFTPEELAEIDQIAPIE